VVQTTQDQVTRHAEHGHTGRAWLAVPGILVLSALMMFAGTIVFHLTGNHYEQRMTRVWDGASLTPAGRLPVYEQGGLVLPRLEPRQQASVELPVGALPTEHYATLELHTSGQGRMRFELAWLDESAPGGVRSIWLPPTAQGTQTIDLGSESAWRGTVGGLFLLMRGPVTEPLILHAVRLRPADASAGRLARQIWQEWTAFEGWRSHSINFIVGGSRAPLISPVLASAAWVALSTLLYVLWALLRRRTFHLTPFAVIFLAGWLALDLRWQVDLVRQLQITQSQFAGKDYHEKRLASHDRDLYRFAEQVKRHLPPEPARLFLIPPSSGQEHRYTRTRLHYLLLPHNVGSLWDRPPAPENTRAGDHLLILRSHPHVNYDHQTGRLHWDRSRDLPVDRLMAHPTGDLYRVR
jgi:hypothetical protein